MRDHGEKASAEINENEEVDYPEDEIRGSRQESGNENYRDLLINVEDQVETSKLVLQLVTDSRFNMTQINGQRKLGGPPPGWKGPAPGPGCEVFVGKIPRTLYEHEIYPIFRRMGEVYEIRLMMDFSGTNRGYCFVMFGKSEFAKRAIRELDNYEIRPGRRIGVVASINNCRLYVGQLPPDVTSEKVIRKIYDITDDVGQVSVYRNANDQARYALISYKTHRGAAMARRRLVPDRASLFGGAEVSIDWAHPSMFPSNVVEDTGVADDHGNIEITRLVVGSENKRYQNRRRVRDDFLDHSIRSYLQSDRALDHQPKSKHNLFASQNQSFDNSLSCISRGINDFYLYDRNSNLRAQSYIQRNYSGLEKYPGEIENARKSRESHSSFDLNVGSGSSDCSGSSSLSSVSERHHNLSKEFSESSIFYPVDNEGEIFSEQVKGEILGGDKRCGKKDPESLNLFDNYTFSVNSRETDLNETEDTRDDFSSLAIFEKNSLDNEAVKICNVGENNAQFFERGNKFSPSISSDLDNKKGHKMRRENERKSREQRYKNSFNRENNNFGENCLSVYNTSHKSTRRSLKPQSFHNSESFPKTIGVPVKNEIRAPTLLNIQNFPRQRNRNGICPLVWNKNGKNFATAARLVAENCLLQQPQLCGNGGNRSAAYPHNKIGNFPNLRNFSHNVNSNSKRFSVQFSQNACDFSVNNLGNNSLINPVIYSDSESSISGSSGFIPQVNSQVNFFPVQNFPNITQIGFCQNKRFLTGKNLPKNGRPILSRSHVSLRNEI